MLRTTLISLLVAGTAVSLSAGYIPLTGQSTNGAGFGISGNGAGTYFNTAGFCAGQGLSGNGPNFNGCATANAPQTAKKNFIISLFGNATNATNTLPSIVPDAALNQPNSTGQIATGFGNGTQFDLMDAPNAASYTSFSPVPDANYYTTTASNSSIVIPVGIYNVTAVDTLLQDYYGTVGHSDITVTFCFSADSIGTSCNNVAVVLTNGTEYRSGVLCDTTLSGGCTTNATNAGVATTTSGLLSGTTANVSGTGIDVKTANVFSTAYSSLNSTVSGATPSPDQGSTGGLLVLDSQQFLLNGLGANFYLAKITITDSGANWSTTNVSGSHAAISALTIETAPEPSTIILFGAGLATLGLSRLRRRK
jgi:hypothetical protein